VLWQINQAVRSVSTINLRAKKMYEALKVASLAGVVAMHQNLSREEQVQAGPIGNGLP
jgi:hypothetical protein